MGGRHAPHNSPPIEEDKLFSRHKCHNAIYSAGLVRDTSKTKCHFLTWSVTNPGWLRIWGIYSPQNGSIAGKSLMSAGWQAGFPAMMSVWLWRHTQYGNDKAGLSPLPAPPGAAMDGCQATRRCLAILRRNIVLALIFLGCYYDHRPP